VVLMPLRFGLAALVNGRFLVVRHYQPVSTYAAHTPTGFLLLREE
jgi:hypothetical protein